MNECVVGMQGDNNKEGRNMKIETKDWIECKKYIPCELAAKIEENDLYKSIKLPRGKTVIVLYPNNPTKKREVTCNGLKLNEYMLLHKDPLGRKFWITHIEKGWNIGISGSKVEMLKHWDYIKNLNINWADMSRFMKSVDIEKFSSYIFSNKG